MVAAAERYPAYWFASNKGYPCPRHVAALAAWGPCAIHRRRWVFMDGLRWSGVPRVSYRHPRTPTPSCSIQAGRRSRTRTPGGRL